MSSRARWEEKTAYECRRIACALCRPHAASCGAGDHDGEGGDRNAPEITTSAFAVEETSQSIGQGVGRVRFVLAGSILVSAGKARGTAAERATEIGREGGIGGRSSDGDGNAVSQGAGGEATDCASCPAIGNQAHQRTCNSTHSCCTAAALACAEEAGEFEDDVVVQGTGGGDGSGACGGAESGDVEGEIVGADVSSVDVDVCAERANCGTGAGAGLSSCECGDAGELGAEIEASEIGVIEANGTGDDGAGSGTGDVEIRGKRSSLKTRSCGEVDSDRGKKGLQLIDGKGVAGYLEVDGGCGSAGLIGSAKIDDRLADGDGRFLNLSRERLHILRQGHLQIDRFGEGEPLRASWRFWALAEMFALSVFPSEMALRSTLARPLTPVSGAIRPLDARSMWLSTAWVLSGVAEASL